MDCTNCSWNHIETKGVLDLTRVRLSDLPEALRVASDQALTGFQAHVAANDPGFESNEFWKAAETESRRRHTGLFGVGVAVTETWLQG